MALPIESGETYILNNVRHGLVADGKTGNVVGEKADGSVLQVWGFFLNDNGLWTIRSGNGKYLSTQDNLSTNGTVLVLTDEETVQWKVKNDSGTAGSINIYYSTGGHGVDLAQSKESYPIHLWYGGGPGNQVWRPDPIPKKAAVSYTGKFNYLNNAKDTNIFVIFPHGIVSTGLLYIFGTWTITSHKSLNAQIKEAALIQLDESGTAFTADAGYYVWKGKTTDNWKSFDLEIWHQTDKEPVSTQKVELFVQRV